MALSVSQNWADDEFEVLEVDSALLMSFLEETQGEEFDHDQLLTVMKSLEAEIDCDSGLGIKDGETGLLDDDDQKGYCHQHSYGWMGGQDSSTSSENLDFKWMDMDMDMVMDSGNWYMDQFGCGNIDDQLIEYGVVRDYSVMYSGLNMGMDEQSYGSLWQES